MKFEISRHKKTKLFHFVIVSGNGTTILTSQPYKAKQSAQRGITSVKKNISLAHRFLHHSKRNGKVSFQLKAGNGEVIADSLPYPDQASMQRSIKSLMKSVPKAKVSDLTRKA